MSHAHYHIVKPGKLIRNNYRFNTASAVRIPAVWPYLCGVKQSEGLVTYSLWPLQICACILSPVLGWKPLWTEHGIVLWDLTSVGIWNVMYLSPWKAPSVPAHHYSLQQWSYNEMQQLDPYITNNQYYRYFMPLGVSLFLATAFHTETYSVCL